MPKPTVFIGSSTEQLDVARSLQRCLSSHAQATLWNEAPFELNESILGGLLKLADQFDFAVFVFGGDDELRIRNTQVKAVRDNVVFELGLFIGHMGRGRAFWMTNRGSTAPHIPVDLTGIIHLMFDLPESRHAKELDDALEYACPPLITEIQKLGPRTDRTVEVLDSVRILCAASSQYSEPRFAEDIKEIQQNFPIGSIESAHGVTAQQLLEYFSDSRSWDIIHLAIYVDQQKGDLIVPSASSALNDRIPIEGVEKLIQVSHPRLVVIVTCDSLVLAARIARITNTIAGHRPIDARAALSWSAVFYHFLAQGCPLSEAFNRAQMLTDPGLVLIAKKDFRLHLPSASTQTK